MICCSLDGCSSALSKEIRLEFTRTMNRILFDKTVTAQPGAFPFVTLPEPHVEAVPQTGEYICAALCGFWSHLYRYGTFCLLVAWWVFALLHM